MTATSTAEIPRLESVAQLAQRYRAWLCDIWGVMHDGVRPHASAVDACKRFRDSGGVVVLLSNAPRPWQAVVAQLDRIGVSRDCYDAIVTSGDVARSMLEGAAAAKVFHLGPPRDRPLFEGLKVRFAGPDEASCLVCTGLNDDETETPKDYAVILGQCHALTLPMICANPDLMVERGDRLVFCAGALAAEYEAMGGQVTYAGKPHLPIYHRAFDTVSRIAGSNVAPAQVLAIGDGVKTDIAGAANAGIDALFVGSKLHVSGDMADANAVSVLSSLFDRTARLPVAMQFRLSW
ncbi:MAG: TIGR01459 family HAD-type hydrolase [Pseudomonadota bacterium]|nr:TIGR01459 family HAD-type hydrolase [Pseudomonadota bacterium]